MPRGKRTVFAVYCTECGKRIGSMRFHKQDKKGKSYKEMSEKIETKYCPHCRKKVKFKMKEERHSK
jgi:ribosomal protein L33